MDQTNPTQQAAPAAPEQPSKLDQWLFSVAAKKAAYGVAKFLAAVIMSVVVQNALHKFGVTVDPKIFMTATAGATMVALEWAHDWLKLKTGLAFL